MGCSLFYREKKKKYVLIAFFLKIVRFWMHLFESLVETKTLMVHIDGSYLRFIMPVITVLGRL